MAQLLVRGLDESIVKRLRLRAKRNGRSLAAEARVILSEAEPDPDAYAKAIAYAEKMQRVLSGRIKGDSADLIREAREARSRAR